MQRQVLISDQSGVVIPENTGAVVTIKFRDRHKGIRVLDLTDEEAERLGGRHQRRRGRKPTNTPNRP